MNAAARLLTDRPLAAGAAILCMAALLLRWPGLGNPAFHVDEQFYLLVGDRMLDGAVPYVDLWDRKPVGLFIIYAGIRAIGGAGIVQYQLVATLFAAATAFVISRIARQRSGEAGALLAGLAYLAALMLFSGGGGQSPVFYNLFMALAGWCVLTALGGSERRQILRLGTAAMALCGIAIQIKTSVVFEGTAFGLALLWGLRARGAALPELAGAAALFVTVALVPTAAVAAAYAAAGHFEAFRFANFESILMKAPDPIGRSAARLVHAAMLLGPMFVVAGLSLWSNRRQSGFFLAWIAAGLAGFLALGNFFDHYALPLLVPLAAAAGGFLGRRPVGPLVLAVLAVQALLLAPFERARTERSRAEIAALADAIPASAERGCLFLFDGPSVLYLLRRACTVTPYVFPDHLATYWEDEAIGVRPPAAVAAAMARRPEVVVIPEQAEPDHSNEASRAVLLAALESGYAPVARRPFSGRMLVVYRRR